MIVKKALAEKCEENGQIVGLYCTPFASWWNTIDEIKQYNLEGTTYKIYDCCLKVNGEPFKLDGAFVWILRIRELKPI